MENPLVTLICAPMLVVAMGLLHGYFKLSQMSDPRVEPRVRFKAAWHFAVSLSPYGLTAAIWVVVICLFEVDSSAPIDLVVLLAGCAGIIGCIAWLVRMSSVLRKLEASAFRPLRHF